MYYITLLYLYSKQLTNVNNNIMYGNFSFQEFITTSTGLSNYPSSPDDLVNLARLWQYLASVREKLREPIIINSAYRTPQVNEQVGGVKCSNHIKGLAADIRTKPIYMDKLCAILFDDYLDGKLSEFINNSTFYHISL